MAQVPAGDVHNEMSESLGEKLRRMREERGISISEVAEQTRISPLYLKSIEQNDYKLLPGGIFNKGFVRSYARYIGFDESEALADYARLMSESETPMDVDQTIHHAEIWTDDRTSRSTAPTIIFAIIILALLAGGIALLVRYLSGPAGPSSVMTNSTSTAANTANANTSSGNPAATETPGGPFTVELKATDERVWIGYTVDGDKNVKTLDPGESMRVDVKDSIALTYSKARAQNLQISVNGKQVNAPSSGTKGTIDVEIDKNNVGRIIQSGEVGTAAQTAETPTPRPTRSPSPTSTSTPAPAQSPTPKSTPRSGVPPTASPRAIRPPANTNTVRRPPQ